MLLFRDDRHAFDTGVANRYVLFTWLLGVPVSVHLRDVFE